MEKHVGQSKDLSKRKNKEKRMGSPNITRKFLWLDLLRGVTALAVFLGHLRTLYFLDYSDVQADSIAKAFFFVTGFGHQAVIIFFVLSGFFIAKTVQNAIDRNQWSFSDYFINRFIRLEVVLIPALLLGMCCDSLGLMFFSQVDSYAGKIEFLPFVSPIGKLNLETFFGNAFFLQSIVVNTFGSNAPLWSLANEFWYYMVFPLLYFIIVGKNAWSTRFLYALVAMGILIFVGESIALYLLIWLMGVAAFYAREKYGAWCENNPIYIKVALNGISVLTLCVLVYVRVFPVPIFNNDCALGFITSVLIVLLSLKEMENAYLSKISIYLSNISYTLYTTHLPICMLLSAWVSVDRHGWGYGNLGQFFILSAVVLLYSTLCWYLFERNTPIIRKAFKQFIRSPFSPTKQYSK
jgi:peptidoglycan/LPS O-acetylase OafA/YrhL